MTPVRVGVIGVGIMGRNHLRVYDQLKECALVGFFESDMNKREEYAELYGCNAYADLDSLLDNVDAVSICAPSTLHEEIAVVCMDRGRHCLVEKPLATTLEGCDRLIAHAQMRGVTLAVGHIERFNPAVQQVSSLLDKGARLHSISVERLSAVSGRIKDVDVIADLMVHDIDIVLALAKSPILSIEAVEARNTAAASGDHVTAVLQFASGVSACCTASRVSAKPSRRLTATTDQGVIEVDYVNQSVDIFLRNETIRRDPQAAAFGEYVSGISLESVQIRRQEPLVLELAHFIECCAQGKQPLVGGAEARAAVEMVARIQNVLQQGQRND